MTFDRRGDDLLGLFRFSDIAGDGVAACSDLRRRLLQDLGPPARDNDRRAAPGELLRRRLAELVPPPVTIATRSASASSANTREPSTPTPRSP